MDPGYRASIPEAQTYISNWLKHAKTRTGGYGKCQSCMGDMKDDIIT